MSDKFHDKAKDAGNKLKAYILSIATGSTGVFFFTLTGKDVSYLSYAEKGLLLVAVFFFVTTVVLSLLELYLDSKRFFNMAEELEKPVEEQDWAYNEKITALRLKMIYATYISISLGFLLTFIYMVLRIS